MKTNDEIGASVEPLRKPAAAQQEEAIAEIVSASHDQAEFGERGINFLRDFQHLEYGTKLYPAAQAVQPAVPDGWQMVPAKPTEAMVGAIMSEGEVDAVAGLAPELRPILLERAGIAARYTAMLAAAPAHPAEGVSAPAAVAVADERAAFEAWAKSENMNIGSDCDGYIHADTAVASMAWQARAALAATQPAAQGVDVVQAAKALCKHAAKVQNINFDDYWLIHAEEFKEEAQIVLDAAQAKQGGV